MNEERLYELINEKERTASVALPALMRKVYVWMTFALVITGFTAYGVANSPGIMTAILSSRALVFGLMIAEFCRRRLRAAAGRDVFCRRVAACLAALVLMSAASSAQNVRDRVESILSHFGAPVGVAWSAGDTVYSVNNDSCYPLMSVFKTHCALAALRIMQRQGTPTDIPVTVRAGRMMTDTYSPMLQRYPADRDFMIPFDSLLRYSIAESDNNACDIIISFAGGLGAINAELENIGLSGFRITETEASMYADPMRSYNNCSTPESVVKLFRKIFEGGVISGDYARCLEEALLATVTGPDKIRGALPVEARLAHKTGTGFTLPDGTKTADNDAGMIIMPDGRRIYIAILIKDSKAGDAANALLMRQVTEAVTGR